MPAKLGRKFSVLPSEEPKRSNTMLNKNTSIGMRDVGKLEKIQGQRRTDVRSNFNVQKNSHIELGKRMTFFGESSESIL